MWSGELDFCFFSLKKFGGCLVAGGIKAILTDQNKLVVAVGGATALAAGVYTTRCAYSYCCTKFGFGYKNKRVPFHQP